MFLLVNTCLCFVIVFRVCISCFIPISFLYFRIPRFAFCVLRIMFHFSCNMLHVTCFVIVFVIVFVFGIAFVIVFVSVLLYHVSVTFCVFCVLCFISQNRIRSNPNAVPTIRPE